MKYCISFLLLAFASLASAQDRQKLLIDRQSAADGDIRILDALYGQDDRLCRAESEVGRQCNGQASCEIRADDSLCGNPYANVAKQLFIGYSCGSDRRSVTVDEGQVARVYCLAESEPVSDESPVASAADAPPANWRRGRVYVAQARYGASDRTCDATSAFSYECDNQRECQVEVGNNLCGDPARGTPKQVLVEYWCNGSLERQAHAENEVASLSCR